MYGAPVVERQGVAVSVCVWDDRYHITAAVHLLHQAAELVKFGT